MSGPSFFFLQVNYTGLLISFTDERMDEWKSNGINGWKIERVIVPISGYLYSCQNYCMNEQDRQRTYIVTLTYVRLTIIAVQKQIQWRLLIIMADNVIIRLLLSESLVPKHSI